jgi:transcription-repair coupling factor (superfamily II helicase)
MHERLLESSMLDFGEKKTNVLVCTTIIESGLDIPTVNTLIVERAELLGLAQMYQLRGRVGRAHERAYAYLFFSRDRSLTEEAYERLKTIAEHTGLGSGFRIAMRDLEIRGAGNLLGEEQHGHIAEVGFELYTKLVSMAVDEAKGAPWQEEPEVRIDLPLEAYIPESYIADENVRLSAYRRIAGARSRMRPWASSSPPREPPTHSALRWTPVGACRAATGATSCSTRGGGGSAPRATSATSRPTAATCGQSTGWRGSRTGWRLKRFPRRAG